ncbi:cold shock CspA family protein [Dysgonomonas sp. PH5-45]|uniref:cold-shock protein n=1 Tax=unclassified Dysgonomonas TaxID=2630389 RepID=UPI002476C2F9|nr:MULTISPECIES: cold shock domain-containing protein [unclassified Dysgonomonas]MDH6355186.1 cold shock CspA family protein [Dysgonomonas sp. PH5-45]MDH6388088.1 cold shock CspA family protein [Dysgonomonas sp. PH5-37]
MAISFNKRELEKKKEQKKQEKLKRKEERKAHGGGTSFEDMIAYVDENGVITSTPPDLSNKQKVEIENIAISTPKKEDEDPVLEGRVEYFNSDKGYGFIKHTGSTDKYFFHVSSAPSSITEGNMVTFELERGQKGMNAVKIAFANKDKQ